MGGQISKDDQNDHLVNISEIIKKEAENIEPDIIIDQFTLTQKKEQIKVQKNKSQIKLGEYTTSQIYPSNQNKKSLIEDLKSEKSQEFVEHQQVQMPSGTINVSQIKINDQQNQQNILSNNQSRIFKKNNPTKVNDPDFQIQQHFPEWANKMIQVYGFYQCPEEINYENTQEAILKYEDGSYYKGQIQGDYRHGYGIFLQEYCIFEGHFEKNIRTGWGRELQKDILKQGIWRDDQIIEKLEIRKQDEYYIGECQDGIPHGKGKLENKEYIYEGQFKNGLKNGKGQLKYKDKKDYYDGQFKNDRMDGNGKYYFSNKVIYDGNFKDGQITGRGEMRYPNNKFYRGDFLNGKMHGQGILQTESGGKHEGQFKDGLKHGYGRTIQNGMEVTGEWKYDVLLEEDLDEQ
ncbi:unnamed protein product [Paramecium pentaurelia]|uniref:MORN repeat protein n=1 Tax=Paramecium pentaurelia TaxID=43138 RepID=A0A8S1UUE0_9CILI|nr:unnamed protein product [Paramecium pentaurelia]